MRKLFLTLFSEGRGDRPCGKCLWRSLNPQHSCYPRLRHSAHSLLAIHASGIPHTPFSLSPPQAFCALPARYPRLRHSAYSLLAIHASGILRAPCSLSAPQAFCALFSRYPRLRHSAHPLLAISPSGILCTPPQKRTLPGVALPSPVRLRASYPHDTPAVG